MNVLIETLAKQAGMVNYPTGLGISENTIWGDRNIAQFAELIVRECAKIADIADENKCEWIGGNILTHFGVKE